MQSGFQHFEWHDSHSVGIPSIDDQHKRLIALTNRLFQAILNDMGEDALAGVLSDLADYAVYHFEHEELLMREHGFPEDLFAAHRAEHRALADKVAALIEEYRQDASCLDLTVYEFLRDWTTEHMDGTDSLYAIFLQERGVR